MTDTEPHRADEPPDAAEMAALAILDDAEDRDEDTIITAHRIAALLRSAIDERDELHDMLDDALAAFLNLAALPVREDEPTGIDPKRLALAIDDHDDICSRMAIPECADRIVATYDRLTREASHVR